MMDWLLIRRSKSIQKLVDDSTLGNILVDVDFIEQFGEELYSPSTGTNAKTVDAIMGKTTMIYFSAQWCVPSRHFTSTLIEFYHKMKKDNKDVEIICVSLDDRLEEHHQHTKDMPWLCTPFSFSEEQILALKKKYGVINTPHVVVVDPSTGDIINPDCAAEVVEDPDGEEFPWKLQTFSEFMPDSLLSKSEMVELSSLDDKYLMVYFSANWCLEGSNFTPILCAAYNDLKANRDDFEIVYLSSDEDETSFEEHYKDMPFLAVPYKLRDVPQGMSQLFDVDAIPRVVMLGPVPKEGGERPVINHQVRSFICEPGRLNEFPFYPLPYKNLATDFVGRIEEKTKCLVVFNEYGSDDEQKRTVEAVKKAAERMSDKEKENDGEDNSKVLFYYAISSGGIVSVIKATIQCENHKESALIALLDFSNDGAYYVANETEVTEKTIYDFIKNPGERFFISKDNDEDDVEIVRNGEEED